MLTWERPIKIIQSAFKGTQTKLLLSLTKVVFDSPSFSKDKEDSTLVSLQHGYCKPNKNHLQMTWSFALFLKTVCDESKEGFCTGFGSSICLTHQILPFIICTATDLVGRNRLVHCGCDLLLCSSGNTKWAHQTSVRQHNNILRYHVQFFFSNEIVVLVAFGIQ